MTVGASDSDQFKPSSHRRGDTFAAYCGRTRCEIGRNLNRELLTYLLPRGLSFKKRLGTCENGLVTFILTYRRPLLQKTTHNLLGTEALPNWIPAPADGVRTTSQGR